jgi:hypothetical protein
LQVPSTQSWLLVQSLLLVHFAARSFGSRQNPSLTEHAPMRTSCARHSSFVLHKNRQKPSTHFCVVEQSPAPPHVATGASLGTHAPSLHFNETSRAPVESLQSPSAAQPAAQ